jgi:hypothetical protein
MEHMWQLADYSHRPNEFMESNSRRTAPLSVHQKFGRAVHAEDSVFSGGSIGVRPMKRTPSIKWQGILLVLLGALATGWFVASANRAVPIVCTYIAIIGHSGAPYLRIENQSGSDYYVHVIGEMRAHGGWQTIAVYPNSSPPPARLEDCWVCRASSVVTVPVALESGDRLRVCYSRVPTRFEAQLYRIFERFGLKRPSFPNGKSVVIFPARSAVAKNQRDLFDVLPTTRRVGYQLTFDHLRLH